MIDQRCADDAQPLPSPCRCPYALWEYSDLAQGSCLSYEGQILHDGDFREPAEPLELIAGDEDALVPIRKLQEARTDIGGQSDETQRRPGTLDGETEGACDHVPVGQGLQERDGEIFRQEGVGMEEQEYPSRRSGSPVVELGGAAAGALFDVQTSLACKEDCPVAAAAIDNDDLAGLQAVCKGIDMPFFIEGRNYNGDI